MRIIECLPLSLLAFLLGCGSSHNDAEIKSKMLGTCLQVDHFSSGIKLSRVTTYLLDGTFTEHGVRTEGSLANKYTVTGYWIIENGRVHYKIHSSTHPGVAAGYKNVNRIVKLDETAVVMVTPQGRRVVCAWKSVGDIN